MKKLFCYLIYILFGFNSFSQVGINTNIPKAQLEIKSSNQVTPANTDGIIIPKIDNFPAINPTAAQNGMMVYLTTTIGVKLSGFYYWQNAISSWQNVSGITVEIDPKLSCATANTIPKFNGTNLVDGIIIDDGTNIGIGVAPLSGNKLEVAGKIKTTSLQVTVGATADYILQSDASGNATWIKNNGGYSHFLGELYLGGIVFHLFRGSDGLEHGYVVSLTESSLFWQNTGTFTGANRFEDGQYNTSLMTDSPAATYVAGLGSGWYLPSLEEFRLLLNNSVHVNKALRAASYTLLSNFSNYWTSLESPVNSSNARTISSNSFGGLSSKNSSNLVRGIKYF